MFLAPWFALAGLVAAAGPVIIHLLNRQRFRVVDWAAMEFLREAVFRSRRMIQLRDLLLMALRTLCLVAFGVAMARPYLAGSAASLADSNQPVHAVLLIDNSLSMGYEKLDGTVLNDAKAEAKQHIEQLPRGSRISVLPTCGSAAGFSFDAYYTKEDALEALAAIEPVDRAAEAHETIDLALEACGRAPNMPAKQIFMVTDQQISNWAVESLEDHLNKLPGPIRVIEIGAKDVENAWIADFRLRDGVADLQTPAVFVATIRYEGVHPRHDVQATLTVDGVTIAAVTLELQPGQAREIQFPPYRFDVPCEPGKPTMVGAEVSIPQDRLSGDDQRFLVVPVMAALPVVFVDQWGSDEDPRRNRFGETYHLRRLLAPTTSRAQRDRQLVKVRHVRIEEVDRELLEDARLVVIAGASSPEGVVPLLREYVEQGGNLVIAAGGFFDPALWTAEAWQDGLGVLPAPLDAVTVGRLPDESPTPQKPFQLDFETMVHGYFLVEGTTREELRDLYGLPFFFKAVAADVGDGVQATLIAATVRQIGERRSGLDEIDQSLARLSDRQSRNDLSAADRAQWMELQRQRSQIEPDWLLWTNPADSTNGGPSAEDAAEASRLSVLAKFDNGLPFLIHRSIGNGEVLLICSGVCSSWNTLSLTNAVLVYDRILRGMLEGTLPDRNVSSQQQVVLPVSAAERAATFALVDPDGRERPLSVDAQGTDRYAVTIDGRTQRGVYRVTATRTKDSPGGGLEAKLWEIPLAINGPAEESELISPEEAAARRRRGQADAVAMAGAGPIGLQPANLYGKDLWRWAMLAVLVCLLVELFILAWPSLRGDSREGDSAAGERIA